MGLAVKSIHRGKRLGELDFGCTNGVPSIYTVDNGVVVRSTIEANSWGNYFTTQQGKGLYNLYGHMCP
ncbi:hypothetical protein [Peribacillus frigoritolerans]|uniref:hypothetical protein n=1 Tax=Peribacillus frigoritolerans TaxID=450367 RepID=UPI0039A2C974